VDESPTKSFLVRNGADPQVAPHHRMAFGKRPEFELFHIPTDPDQLVNLAGKPAHAATLASLRKRLTDFLKATDDPRVANRGASWDTMPFYLPGRPPVPVTRESHPFLFE
jgi:N-sulfoglucosamine sulfohydrolase